MGPVFLVLKKLFITVVLDRINFFQWKSLRKLKYDILYKFKFLNLLILN